MAGKQRRVELSGGRLARKLERALCAMWTVACDGRPALRMCSGKEHKKLSFMRSANVACTARSLAGTARS
jgi:hypothetical protein